MKKTKELVELCDQIKEDGPQTVEVRVWTNSLTCLNITPICADDEKVMNLLSEGDFDDSTEEAVRELQEDIDMGYTEVLFVNGDDGIKLTVDDGKNGIRIDEIRLIDLNDGLHRNGIVDAKLLAKVSLPRAGHGVPPVAQGLSFVHLSGVDAGDLQIVLHLVEVELVWSVR